MITTKELTPTQEHLVKMLNALDGILDNRIDEDWHNELIELIFLRPRTLRAALAAYLYKCANAYHCRY